MKNNTHKYRVFPKGKKKCKRNNLSEKKISLSSRTTYFILSVQQTEKVTIYESFKLCMKTEVHIDIAWRHYVKTELVMHKELHVKASFETYISGLQ